MRRWGGTGRELLCDGLAGLPTWTDYRTKRGGRQLRYHQGRV